MVIPFGLSVVSLTVALGGPQLSMMRHDSPSSVVEKHDEHGIAVLGEPLDAVALASVSQPQAQSKDRMPRSAWMFRPLQN
jgi:hypothetical protein